MRQIVYLATAFCVVYVLADAILSPKKKPSPIIPNANQREPIAITTQSSPALEIERLRTKVERLGQDLNQARQKNLLLEKRIKAAQLEKGKPKRAG